ncbi:hypothetical protein EGJ86_19495 [Pseudomonas sp. o96-267]|uniref:DotH/IcmK family type IV secretion protein n=1 Tax=Pseudomonas sp. o96-267 TaxID=2479853 RepID=UPI000F78C53C|nr:MULTISPECIES: DotH/IcmK family type IV secretion protein [Pseudomonas]MDH0959050.1 DotH/IcmK family type IV secretion protein [Pseudomonas chengduensis]MDV5863644.1 DotH/IcmK family type IV secretion protein [Pseudomonas mendocina]RRV31758.1 hypothetical protein EGJ86_19495 [Pseudomonas sp. o96-267]
MKHFSMKLAVVSVLFAAVSSVNAEEVVVAQEPIEQRLDNALSTSPQTVLKLRKKIQDFSAAKQAPIEGDFEPGIPQEVLDIEEMFDISLEPDQIAPKIFLARYQSTAISFVDAYGKPWPIRKISNFLDGLVLIEKAVTEDAAPQQKGNGEEGGGGSTSGIDIKDPQAGSFTMTALKHGVVGNITVYLHGLATPVTIVLVGKPSMFHRVATLRVAEVGPQTDTALLFQNSGVAVGTPSDADLNNALYGVGPIGSEEMVVEGAEGKAWLKGKYLYLQTPVAVFSPEILRTSPGNGKFRAYKFERTPVVMGTDTGGKTVTLRIKRHPATAIHEENNLRTGGM